MKKINIKKLLAPALNLFEVFVAKHIRGFATGVLKHIDDPRDYKWVGSLFNYEKKFRRLDHAGKEWNIGQRFTQYPFNICVFASAVMAASWQNGVRFSVRWMVKLAKREGMITGNGFSYLRAAKVLATKYGHLPHHYMRDEIAGMSWWEYSAWTTQDEALLSIAAKFKVKEYKKISSASQAHEALDNGHCLSTACKWYQGMNRPRPMRFILKATGRFIGGHAYAISGYDDNMFICTNSFGKSWGNRSQAADPGLFEAHDYATYVESFIDEKVLAEHVATEFAGMKVKGADKAIYFIDNGKKHGFTSFDKYRQWCDERDQNYSFKSVKDSILSVIPDGDMI